MIFLQPHLVEKAIIVDVSPVTTSPALKNMGEIFGAMRRVSLPSDIGLPEARYSVLRTPLLYLSIDFLLFSHFIRFTEF